MEILEKDYDEFEGRLKKLSYATDYIPSSDDLVCVMEDGKLPDRFVPFFMWLDMHHPEPIDEEEKKILKRIRKILYTSVEITEETDGAL